MDTFPACININGGRPQVPPSTLFHEPSVTRVEPPTSRKLAEYLTHMTDFKSPWQDSNPQW